MRLTPLRSHHPLTWQRTLYQTPTHLSVVAPVALKLRHKSYPTYQRQALWSAAASNGIRVRRSYCDPQTQRAGIKGPRCWKMQKNGIQICVCHFFVVILRTKLEMYGKFLFKYGWCSHHRHILYGSQKRLLDCWWTYGAYRTAYPFAIQMKQVLYSVEVVLQLEL